MKSVKTILCAVMVLFIVASMGAPALAASFNTGTLEGIIYIQWDGIVRVTDEYGNKYDEYGYPYVDPATGLPFYEVSILGTGFFVGAEGTQPQYIVTNCHVVREFIEVDAMVREFVDEFKSFKTYFPLYVYYDQTDAEEAFVVDYDIEKDIAILKINSATNKRSPLMLNPSQNFDPKSNVEQGQAVWAVGYPYIADVGASATYMHRKEDATVTVGSINRMFTESGTGRRLHQTDAKIRGGNSGGPLVDGNKCVLGINTESLIDQVDPNMNYAVMVDDVIPLLNKNSVPYTLWSARGGGGLQDYLVYIIVGAVVLILLIVLIILITKGKKAPAPAMAAAAPVGAPPPVMSPVPVMAGPVPSPPPPRPAGSPLVRSMSPQHNGMTVALTGGPVTVGRDVAACRIVFKEGTPGVSSRHCKIEFNARDGVFILTDLRSTYGTFLSDGQQLTPNVPYTLKQRDSFYLGERDNAMYVDMG